MTTGKRKLPPESADAQDLVKAITSGEMPRNYTAAKILKLSGSSLSA